MTKPDEAHKRTDKELADLERRISQIYSEAAKDMQNKIDDYFQSFEKRDAEMKEWIANGKITEEKYIQWRLSQIGRGKRFETMRDALAERMTHANEIAVAYMNGKIPKIYALNHRYTIESVQKQAGDILDDIDFTLLNEQTIKRLLVEHPDLMPYYPEKRAIERGIDLAWGKKQITSIVTSGILQGKSINSIAKDLMDNIKNMGRISAIRAARTAITEAENAGRQAATEELEAKGVIMAKQWLSIIDGRTRDAHIDADGQEVANDEPFIVGGEELMFPGDKSMGASGWNLYNCRCTRVGVIKGFNSILTDAKRKKANIRVSG